ncbi:MAG: Hsp20/alpha crystallin family protein [Bacteroidetes bacterium]|nr:Hsp20/alpha crystallin family protein [Bacteroidota bacterium]
MTLLKKDQGTLAPFRSMLSDFFKTNDFFEDGFGNRSWLPAVNVSENEKHYEIDVAVPGMKKDDFKVTTKNGMLVISSEKKEEKEEKKKNYTRQEYNYHSFSRSFSLPEDVKEDDIKATYTDGVLKLVLGRDGKGISKGKEIAIG